MITRPIKYIKNDILTNALLVAKIKGYNHITRDDLAFASRCSPAQISRMFGTMISLRRAIISAAIDRLDYIVIGQAIANKDSKVGNLSEEVKRKALESLL